MKTYYFTQVTFDNSRKDSFHKPLSRPMQGFLKENPMDNPTDIHQHYAALQKEAATGKKIALLILNLLVWLSVYCHWINL